LGQLGSALPAMSPPRFVPTPAYALAGRCEKWRELGAVQALFSRNRGVLPALVWSQIQSAAPSHCEDT